MAKIDFVLQAVTTRFHAGELRKLLAKRDCQRILASVAFVRLDGVNALAGDLKALATIATFFVGIRNGVTSAQGLKRLLDIGVRLFAVDTASRTTIFHPKLFLVERKTAAALVIGSANLTFPGLHNNIEAGAILDLDLSQQEDKTLLTNVLKVLDELPARFPEHVFQIKDETALDKLFDEGRLEDEDVIEAPAVSTAVRKGSRDGLKPMKLVRHTPPARKRKAIKPKPGAPLAPKAPTEQPAPTPAPSGFSLIWESRGLTERDLNIPKGAATHATGSMLWKKGAAEDIDHRHFFRDEAFADLDWKTDPALPHYERCMADFYIVVKGINCGKFKLKLSHNTRTNTATYKQKNAMTQVHWADAHNVIAKRDLLGRTMSLHRKEGPPPEFLIEID
jgi:HKD family nuclease